MDREKRVQLAARTLLGAAAAIVVGTFLPWATAQAGLGSFSRNGLDGGGDGIITLIAGGLLAFLALVLLTGRDPGLAWIAVFCLGCLAGGVAFYDIANVSDRAQEVNSEFVSADVGSGLYLIAAGAVATIAGAIALVMASERAVAVGQ